MRRNSIRQSIGPKMPVYSKQRNIRDPLYKQQCIQKISSYLGDVDPKSLELPTVKEFQALFRFFYSQYEPNTDLLDSKFEDEAISFLKMVKYPFMTEITKSQLISISPHSWPALLSMLAWLSDISLHNPEKICEEETLDSLFHEFICDSFKEYMLTGVESKEKEEIFTKKVEELIKKKEEETKELKRKMKEEVEKSFSLQNQKISELVNCKNEFKEKYKESRISDISEILRNMRARKDALARKNNSELVRAKELEAKNKESDLESESLKSELNFREAEVNRFAKMYEEVKNRISQQGMTPSEVSSLKAKEISVTAQIQEAKNKKKELAKTKSENEKILNEKREIQSKMVNDFVKMNKENKTNYKNEEIFDITEENILSKDLHALIFRLKEILGEFSVRFQFSISERNSLTSKKNELTRQIEDYNEKIKEVSEEIIELGNQYLKMKENFDMAERRSEKEFDQLKRGIDRLKLEGHESVTVAEQEYSLAVTKFDLCAINLAKKREAIDRESKECMEGIVSRFAVLDDILKKIQKK